VEGVVKGYQAWLISWFKLAGLFMGSISTIVLIASIVSLVIGRTSEFDLSSALLGGGMLILSVGTYKFARFLEREWIEWHGPPK
jgi:hypothetical protein